MPADSLSKGQENRQRENIVLVFWSHRLTSAHRLDDALSEDALLIAPVVIITDSAPMCLQESGKAHPHCHRLVVVLTKRNFQCSRSAKPYQRITLPG
ncbi:addiction module toxin [Pantoea ananatis PA13]|nr:addiction module toxin [Pantoea ananatis PA13]